MDTTERTAPTCSRIGAAHQITRPTTTGPLVATSTHTRAKLEPAMMAFVIIVATVATATAVGRTEEPGGPLWSLRYSAKAEAARRNWLLGGRPRNNSYDDTDHIPPAQPTSLYPRFTTELTTTFDRRRFGKHLPIHWRPFFATLREAIVGA